MNKEFWKDKRVLITGHEGFLGSWLATMLVECDAEVVGVDIETNREKTIYTSDVYEKIETIKGSITDDGLIDELLQKHTIEYVFHLAAEALVGECLENPCKGFSTNIEGTWKVLEACRLYNKLDGIIVASTDKAYGIHDKLPYSEEAPLNANAPYDVSKSCADMIARSYYLTYDLPITITRCGNIYGPGDFNFSRIIPDVIRTIVQKEVLQIRSDGKFIRDYVYVKDVANAYLMLAEHMGGEGVLGEAFNFSDEDPKNVLNIVESIYDVMGVKGEYVILNAARTEIPAQYLSAKKAQGVLKWKCEYSFEKALEETIEWYRKYLSGE